MPTAQPGNSARLIATGRVPIGNEATTLFFSRTLFEQRGSLRRDFSLCARHWPSALPSQTHRHLTVSYLLRGVAQSPHSPPPPMRRQHFFIAVRCVEISRSALATGPTPSPLKPIVISRCHTYYEEWRNHRTRPTPRLDLRYYQTDLPKACHEKLSDYFWPRLLITAVVCDIQRGWGEGRRTYFAHTEGMY